jgi:two-component system nitrate/nitrite response regulator NarL
MTVTVLIVDDLLFAEALHPQLEEGGFEVVGAAPNSHAAALLARKHTPDVALIDLSLGEENGFDVADLIRQVSPGTRSVVLTARDDSSSVAEALSRGLHGYLTKDLSVADLISAIGSVVGGQVVLPPSVTPTRNTRSRMPKAVLVLVEQLTPREWEVLELLVEGADGPTIGALLGITQNTVRTHVQGILTKLQLHSRLEAATFAMRYGLFEPTPGPGLSRSA